MAISTAERFRTLEFHESRCLSGFNLVLKAWGSPGELLVSTHVRKLHKLGSGSGRSRCTYQQGVEEGRHCLSLKPF